MYKKEYKPLFEKGFQQIALWQLDSTFLEPFEDNEQRKYLIDRLKAFINEFQFLGLKAEIWIDGSFSTHKPEPQDIDVVFLLDQKAVAGLDSKKAQLFNDLFMKREEVRARYSLDVYFIDKDDEEDKQNWISTYGFDSRKMNSKGIYKIEL
jgi:hypothetical protein